MGRAPRRPRRQARRKELAWPPRAAHPLDRGLCRPGLEGQPDARAVERGEPADRPVSRDADRPDLVLQDVVTGRASVRLGRTPLALPGSERADRLGLPPGLQEGRLGVAIGDSVDWAASLGGGASVALVQAGTFRSDAGTLFGPVPRVLWGGLVADEIDASHRILQALNCLLIETPSGRVLVETGIGERVDDKTRSIRGYEGTPIVPALDAAGFLPESITHVVMSHLHFDHAGGLLRS